MKSPPKPIANPTVSQTREVWDRIADFWDRHIGDGNDFQKTLIMPATDRLLDLQPAETILDIACGNGNYSRDLARRGAKVIACDFSKKFLDCAQKRTNAGATIKYVEIDATDADQLLSLGENQFDAAVCSMAMMDMVTIQPLLQTLPRLLRPGGRFVFSLPHPCFNSNKFKLTSELVVANECIEQVFAVQIHEYLSERAGLSVGILNQSEPHYFFHRPLSTILTDCVRAGFVIDGFEEPAFPAGSGDARNPFSWSRRPEIPPAVVIRARRH